METEEHNINQDHKHINDAIKEMEDKTEESQNRPNERLRKVRSPSKQMTEGPMGGTPGRATYVLKTQEDVELEERSDKSTNHMDEDTSPPTQIEGPKRNKKLKTERNTNNTGKNTQQN
jgi:predicted RNA-binding protein YlxR (DUF448 family)